MKELTGEEQGLLLYLETCAVDLCGRVGTRHMNDADQETAKRWNSEGFVEYGRIRFADCDSRGGMWCHLSPDAWQRVHALRHERAEENFKRRPYQRTCDVSPPTE